MSQSSPATLRILSFRWILLTLLTLGIVLAGLPATSASAAADGVLKGTVTFHESTPTRTLAGLPRGGQRHLDGGCVAYDDHRLQRRLHRPGPGR